MVSCLFTVVFQTSAADKINICVGKEWYRFPSNFFLPSSRFSLSFIQSNFTGQLPKPYSNQDNATWMIPTDMNDQNRQEMSRYVITSHTIENSLSFADRSLKMSLFD